MPTFCARCGQPISDEHPQTCWYCGADICIACWEDPGHCGHPEAAKANADARDASWKERADIAKRARERKPD